MVKIRIWKKIFRVLTDFLIFFPNWMKWKWKWKQNLSTTTKGIEPRKKNIQTKNISRIFLHRKKTKLSTMIIFFLLKYFQSQGHNHHYRLAIFYIMVMVMVMFFFVVGWQNLRWSRNRICRMCDNNNNNDGDDGLCIFFMPNKKKCPDSPQRWSMNIPNGGAEWMNEPRLDILAV